MNDLSHAVPHGSSIADAASLVDENGCTAALDDDGSLLGVVTEEHIVACIGKGRRPSDTLTADCVGSDALTALSDAPIDTLAWMIQDSSVGCIPVLDSDGCVVGVLHERAARPYDVLD